MTSLKHLLFIGFILMSLLLTGVVVGQDGPVLKAPPAGSNLPITNLAYEADFADTTIWRSAQSTDGSIEFTPTDSGYTLSSNDPEGGIAAVLPPDLTIDNFYTEIEFTINTCRIPESALLFFTRMTPDTDDIPSTDSYVFVLQCNGGYRVRPVNQGIPAEITVSGETMQLEEGERYAMGILLAGSSVVWYLDGTEVARFQTPFGIRDDGRLTPGVQRGLSYTLNTWQIWNLKSTGAVSNTNGSEPSQPTPGVATSDPLNAGPLGSTFFRPGFAPPTPIELGLHHGVAAYISGENLSIYNNDPLGILQFTDIDQNEYYLEVVLAVRACGDRSSVGLAWHANETFDSYNAVQVQCDGGFRAYQVTDGQAGSDLATGSIDRSLREFPRGLALGIYVQDTRAWLYLEGRLLAQIDGSTLTNGHAGLLLASSEDGIKMDILVAEIAAYNLR